MHIKYIKKNTALIYEKAFVVYSTILFWEKKLPIIGTLREDPKLK
jgi:hypothetical protein